ncbi:hypothetical protein [Streptomyces sp. NPDC058092]|uniref:hypothetical protein n=1 Tax=Streptomyces sp. NPDC058092 TaxID=3346336 RepID=UPI0036F0EE8B
MSRAVQRIVVRGYRSIEEVDLTLGVITALVGPNGAGRSNFIEAVELLGSPRCAARNPSARGVPPCVNPNRSVHAMC